MATVPITLSRRDHRGEAFRLAALAPAAMTIGGERAEGPVGDGDGRRGGEAITGYAERGAAEEKRRGSHSSMAANPGVMRSSTPRGPRATKSAAKPWRRP